MATTQPSLSVPNHTAQLKSMYDIEVTGSWNVRRARRDRANKKYSIVFFHTIVLSCIALFSTIMLLSWICRDGCPDAAISSSSNDTELLLRIQSLEARVSALERSQNKGIAASERRKRSIGERIRGKKRIKSNRTRNIGTIGPWQEQLDGESKLDSFGLRLVENDRKLEVICAGKYFIYAQVTYLSKDNPNSYAVNVDSAVKNKNSTISVCTIANIADADNEVSCYTGAVYWFNSGDIMYLQQTERNRVVNPDGSSTFFGVMLLSRK